MNDKISCNELKQGRIFTGSLPHGVDLVQSIEDFCRDASIKMATFSLIGALSSVTIGSYDQKQQVYVSFSKHAHLEVVSCTGNISIKDGSPMAHAHIVLADIDGNTFGGHLFSESIIFAGEIEIQELTGEQLERKYDTTTGLMLWNI